MYSFPECLSLLNIGLRLMHDPVGISFMFDKEEADHACKTVNVHEPIVPLTFCQAELGARMEGISVLLRPEKTWCTDARFCFGIQKWSLDDVKALSRFCSSEAQTERFIESKPHFPRPVEAVLISPLQLQDGTPDVVHFCCDNMQAYHLLNDWMAVRDVHPLRPNLCINSSVCGGAVFCALEKQANLTLACAGSYNSGKMERGEINVFIPGSDLPLIVERIARRKERTGGYSNTKPGMPYPGPDICQNCPVIRFKKIEQ